MEQFLQQEELHSAAAAGHRHSGASRQSLLAQRRENRLSHKKDALQDQQLLPQKTQETLLPVVFRNVHAPEQK